MERILLSAAYMTMLDICHDHWHDNMIDIVMIEKGLLKSRGLFGEPFSKRGSMYVIRLTKSVFTA